MTLEMACRHMACRRQAAVAMILSLIEGAPAVHSLMVRFSNAIFARLCLLQKVRTIDLHKLRANFAMLLDS